jgi:ATP adenylyltransferase
MSNPQTTHLNTTHINTTNTTNTTSSIAQLPPGTLWHRATTATAHGLACGALEPLATTHTTLNDRGICFSLRILDNLRRKAAAKQAKPADFNPFLPYDRDLFVADISNTHVCVLNKYNVFDHHLLIITRNFEAQTDWLNEADFFALWLGLRENGGLGFYNGGTDAGASQKHKHLQLVPFPLVPHATADRSSIPIANAVDHAEWHTTDGSPIGTAPDLPFPHAIAPLEPIWGDDPAIAARETLRRYHHALSAIGLPPTGTTQTGAYNLLMTRDWLLVVPRSCESVDGDAGSISINALGFAGMLLAKNEAQHAWLQQRSPLDLLTQVCPDHT